MLSLSHALERAARLPSVSVVLSQALEEMNKPEADISRLADLLARDQGAVARLLRVANSAFYGLSGRVSSLSQAVTLIGLPTTRTLVTAATIIDRFPSHDSGAFDHLGFWKHSLGVAAASRYLAPRAQVNPETAFLGGMLHDIGIAVLGCCLEEEYRAVLDRVHAQDCAIMEAELATLGFTHNDLGAVLAEQWKFPPAIQEAIRGHHDLKPEAAPLVRVVHVANVLALTLDIGEVEGSFVPPVDPASWAALHFTEPELAGVLEAIDRQAQSAMDLLGKAN
ncbi:MAG: HDOD domain-containing protein [Hydrogenophilales bacterium]|nr:HDOD domain-containing protein [Hydrogenophilales bacterium]